MGSVLDELLDLGMKRCRWCGGEGNRGDRLCGPCGALGAVWPPKPKPEVAQQRLALQTTKRPSRRSLEWEMARARRSLPHGWTVGIARASGGLRITKPLGEAGEAAYTFTALDANDAIQVARDIEAGRCTAIQPGPPVPVRRARGRW